MKTATTSEVTTLSVMFYYSPEFAAVTEDIEGYMSSLVSYANIAYLNSDVNICASSCSM